VEEALIALCMFLGLFALALYLLGKKNEREATTIPELPIDDPNEEPPPDPVPDPPDPDK
jgi:hypothetical protein